MLWLWLVKPRCVEVALNIAGKFRMSHTLSQKYVTIPEVFDEIKDEQSRHRLQHLPYELEVREPSDMALAAGLCPTCSVDVCVCLHPRIFSQSRHMPE
jgi:rRNA maturation endonuclease Nob1